MRRSSIALAALLTACATGGRGYQAVPTYDVIIANAKIVDGTGNPWFYGDVAVRGDYVVKIAPAGSLDHETAVTRVDAQGRVLAPGFIDIQGQSYELLTGDGRDVSKITQGVTTEILGEGSTPAPTNVASPDAAGGTSTATAGPTASISRAGHLRGTTSAR